MITGDSGISPSVLTGAVTGLVGAVVYLFKLVMDKGHEQTELSRRVGRLEGEHEGIKKLSANVLETVHRAVAEKFGEQEDAGDC